VAARSAASANTKAGKAHRARAHPSFIGRRHFEELDKFVRHRCVMFGMQEQRPAGDGSLTGSAASMAALVYVFAQDFTVFPAVRWRKPTRQENLQNSWTLPCARGAPVIGLNDSGGARIQARSPPLSPGYAIFPRNTLASRSHPADQRHHGPCAGGAVYSPAITDFIFMNPRGENFYMFVTGPDVIKTCTHEEVTKQELGGRDDAQ